MYDFCLHHMWILLLHAHYLRAPLQLFPLEDFSVHSTALNLFMYMYNELYLSLFLLYHIITSQSLSSHLDLTNMWHKGCENERG